MRLRIGMTAGLRLDLDAARHCAFYDIRHILSSFRPRHRDGLNLDIEIVSVNPSDLVKRIVRIRDAVVAAVADGV